MIIRLLQLRVAWVLLVIIGRLLSWTGGAADRGWWRFASMLLRTAYRLEVASLVIRGEDIDHARRRVQVNAERTWHRVRVQLWQDGMLPRLVVVDKRAEIASRAQDET